MCCQVMIVFCTIILYEMLASVRDKNMNFHKNPQAIDNFYRTVHGSFCNNTLCANKHYAFNI